MNIKNLLLVSIFLFISANVFSQFTFSVSSGDFFELNGANFGYKINDRFVPFVGLQYLNVNSELKETVVEYKTAFKDADTFTDKEDITANVYIPTIGMKYFFIHKNKLKAYGSISLFKPFANAKDVYNGEEGDYLDEIVGAVNVWGGSLGFGSEYFIDENFSVGGEFGLRSFRGTYSETNEEQRYDYGTGEYYDADITNDVLVCLRPTYTRISLNYYF